MADTIFITGARGGAGATVCAVYLGIALSAEGERTLILDGDADFGNGLETCGLQNLSVYTLADAEEGACRVKQAILQHPASPNLYILPSLDCKSPEFIQKAVTECEPLFDRIICDGAAMSACKRAVLVTEPYPCALPSAKKRGAQLRDFGFKDVKLIINKVNGGLIYGGEILPPNELSSVVQVPLLGIIPEDLNLPLGKMRPRTQRAFATLAANVLGKSKKTYAAVKYYSGLSGVIKRKLRGRV